MQFKDYQKYRWFITSTKKLVIGGKNAEQNEELLKTLSSKKQDYIIMHTAAPGSPFSVVLSSIPKVTESDIKESAIFTASFSRAWREEKKKVDIDIFKLSQLYKTDKMKTGTWGVKKIDKRISTPLELVLTKQKDKLKAVPEISVSSKKQIFIKIIPGKTDKTAILNKIQNYLPKNIKQDEILSALPPGGIKIKK